MSISLPRNKKKVQSFIGKVNFLRRFIINCAEIMRKITNMLKKDNEIKWTQEAKQAFNEIKKALTKALVLITPNFEKDFQIYSFASDHTIASVLL